MLIYVQKEMECDIRMQLEPQFLIMYILKSSVLLKYIPELEIGVNHAVGESLPADTDTLKHTVTGELMHHQVGVNETCRRRENLTKLREYVSDSGPLQRTYLTTNLIKILLHKKDSFIFLQNTTYTPLEKTQKNDVIANNKTKKTTKTHFVQDHKTVF